MGRLNKEQKAALSSLRHYAGVAREAYVDGWESGESAEVLWRRQERWSKLLFAIEHLRASLESSAALTRDVSGAVWEIMRSELRERGASMTASPWASAAAGAKDG